MGRNNKTEQSRIGLDWIIVTERGNKSHGSLSRSMTREACLARRRKDADVANARKPGKGPTDTDLRKGAVQKSESVFG